MANVAAMGPPPSPKEPRRSGRRSVPSTSTSKSPGGSPTSETAPKSKDSSQRPSLSSTGSFNRAKRTKNEDIDVSLEEMHKNGVNGITNGRAKRKSKEKDKTTLTIDIPLDEDPSKVDITVGEGDAQEEEEEEAGVTRCVCQEAGMDESEAGEFMAECETCHDWQHGNCMGFDSPASVPKNYFCEKCKPDLWPDLLQKFTRRIRQSSTATSRHPPRSSRSHSPQYPLKVPKRRNTMNSRDAAYDIQALLESTAAEAEAEAAKSAFATAASPVALSVQIPDTNGHSSLNGELEIVSSTRRKRKRTDDDAVSAKRTRSASIVSDRTHILTASAAIEASPATPKLPLPPPPSTTTVRPAGTRGKRGGARKAAMQLQDVASVDGDEAASTSGRRPGNSRAKASSSHDHPTRRSQLNGLNGPTSYTTSATSSRAYRDAHSYAASQQPLFTSWNLPDYLSHLEAMLPTHVPRPLEVRTFGAAPNGSDATDRTQERGVKVKWPSKRMSVGDMNKRVRALVEWVGREQASAMERSRRREAVEKSLRDARAARSNNTREGDEGTSRRTDASTITDGGPSESPQEIHTPAVNGQSAFSLDGLGPEAGSSTMKMMEELMEELISFQERFGPGAKMKDRERRMATVAS